VVGVTAIRLPWVSYVYVVFPVGVLAQAAELEADQQSSSALLKAWKTVPWASH